MINKMNIVYKIIDPRNDEIRYIGKSEQGTSRFNEHLKPSSLEKNNHKNNWIKQLISLNLTPVFAIIEICDSPDKLFEREKYWYDYYLDNGANLTNSTECGLGTRGYKHNDETKRKIGEKTGKRMKGQPLPKGMRISKEKILIDNIEHLECTKCKSVKSISKFSYLKSKNTYDCYCKECRNKMFLERKRKNPRSKLSKEEYVKAHALSYIRSGEASKRPEVRQKMSESACKAITATHTETGEILEFSSALKAKESGFQNSNIGQAIKFNKPYRGYIWKFK